MDNEYDYPHVPHEDAEEEKLIALFEYSDDVTDIAEALEELGYSDVAAETREVAQTIEGAKDLVRERASELSDVWRAVESYEDRPSNDTREQVRKAVEKHQKRQTADSYPAHQSALPMPWCLPPFQPMFPHPMGIPIPPQPVSPNFERFLQIQESMKPESVPVEPVQISDSGLFAIRVYKNHTLRNKPTIKRYAVILTASREGFDLKNIKLTHQVSFCSPDPFHYKFWGIAEGVDLEEVTRTLSGLGAEEIEIAKLEDL